MLFAMFKLETLLPEAPLEKVKIQLFKIFEFVPMIFTGMLNGAVVVSEYSSYLDETFVNNQDLFMYDWQNTEQQMEVIEKLISDEDYRLSIAQNAYNKAIREHTWESRANQILEAVCIIYGLSD